MTWYRTGTIAVTNGSTTVTGTGTAWVANVIAGYGIILPDGRLYEIASIVSNTSLTLRTGYLGATATGQSYAVAPLRGPEVRLAQDIAALINDYGAAFLGAGQGRFTTGTIAAPSVRNAADENTGLNLLGSDQLQLVTGGVARLLLTTSAATLNVPLGGTAVTQSATDATAGRLLKVGDYGAGAAAGTVLFGRANILGTVSQGSGVPTGAIIERGSNENGEYVRSADGTQICTHVQTSLSTGHATWTYPAGFAASRTDALMAVPTGLTGARNAAIVAATATTATFVLRDALVSGALVAGDVNLIAIGRWF